MSLLHLLQALIVVLMALIVLMMVLGLAVLQLMRDLRRRR